uniref:Uncharacterized protein n=1 Tax=Amblyomma maculatum TaxID=34609 RepID=G3MKK3_AMBMU
MLPKVVLSPLKHTVQIVSKATENGETVTCISIPDPPQPGESPQPKHCTTLEDVIDSVLSPERRRALCQTESVVAVPPPPSGAAEAQNRVVIMPENGQVMVCTSNGMTQELRALTTSPLPASPGSPVVSNIIYPNMVFSTVPSLNPISFVMSGAMSTSATGQLVLSSDGTVRIASQTANKPIAKKRLPLLQPRGPLPTQPSPPAAFKRIEEVQYSREMSNRLKSAKQTQEIIKRAQPGHSVSTQVESQSYSAVVQSSTTSKPRTPEHTLTCSGCSGAASNEKSPRLKSLVTVATRRAISTSHVRALDFGGSGTHSGKRAQGSADEGLDGAPSDNLAETLETIRTSLTGAMNRALRSNTEASSGLDSETKKRKAKPHNTEGAKKAKSEEYLKSMDVNKFLDKIHHN